MRTLGIVFGVAVFLAYCWASVAYQNQVEVPEYRTVSVDILGDGRTRAQWDADPQAQFQRLMMLESAKYQLPEEEGAAGEERYRPLSSAFFSDRIAELAPERGLVMTLRDTTDIYRIVNRNYLLRDPVRRPGDGDDQTPLYRYAERLDKEMIDGLRRNGIRVVTVTGDALPVDFEVGTSVMIAVIFLTLLAALKPRLWDPFRIMLDKRHRELEAGAEATRRNLEHGVRLEETRRAENTRLLGELDDLRKRLQGDAERAANGVVHEARIRERANRQSGLLALRESAERTGMVLKGEIPELAGMIADAVLAETPPNEWKD